MNDIMIENNKKIYTILVGIVLLSACSETEMAVQDARTEYLCTLEENIAQISKPTSFAVSDDGWFVLCDNKNVYLYSPDGKQSRKIGNVGNAKYEYNYPSLVKVHKDTVYVWSSYTMKFIAYTPSGEPVAQYAYKFAVSDFEVTDHEIIIYTAGYAIDNIIEVYDKSTSTVTKRLTPSSDEHKVLLHNWSASPILAQGESVYYSSRDKLDVFRYGEGSPEGALYEAIESDSFRMDEVKDYNALSRNRNDRREYLYANPQVICIFPGGKDMYVMTVEGKETYINGEHDTSGRHFVLYRTGKKSGKTAVYSYESIGTERLVDAADDGLYIIMHSIEDDNDVYTLNKLQL